MGLDANDSLEKATGSTAREVLSLLGDIIEIVYFRHCSRHQSTHSSPCSQIISGLETV